MASENTPSTLLKGIDAYYTERVLRYGSSPQGVDWNSEESQLLRFNQILKVVTEDAFFSMNDLGCGYGKLYVVMKEKYRQFSYRGYDISAEMINMARSLHIAADCKFVHVDNPSILDQSDYTVSSGIFNVKLGASDQDWLAYIMTTLATMNHYSKKGFSFNVLTKYSDPEYMKDYLYYADPCLLFDHCKRTFSRNVALLHDYNLYEFTIIVRK